MLALKTFLKDSYGIEADLIKPIAGGLVNTNWRVNSGVNAYILKQYDQKTVDEVRFETDILEALAGSLVPSPRLVSSTTGDVISSLQNKPCIVYEYIAGNPANVVSESLLKEIGVLTANLHVALKDFKPLVKKQAWELEDLKKMIPVSSESLNKRGYSQTAELCSFVLAELKRFDSFPTLPLGITHQDIKLENILVRAGRISGIIDFDNSFYGTILDDITTTIIWTCFEGQKLTESRVVSLLNGYESIRPLTTEERECLNERIRLRLLREVFISPYLATRPQEAYERSEYFKKLYKKESSRIE